MIIEDLFLLAGPRVETEYDPVVEEERLQKSKHERLETAELFSSTIDAQQLSQDLHQESFTTQLITKIVDNLQVTIKNIHIRFEDSTSNPERMFAVGVTLKSLSAVSTDADWNDSFIVNPQDAVNKLVKLHSFSVYWNTRDQPVQKLTYEEFVRTARELIDHDDHSYVLRPVSGIGKATLNKHLVEGVPKTLIDVFFDAFALNLNYEQYFDILSTLAAFSTAQRALPYRKFRPAGDSLSSAELFRYAITCYRSQISERNRRRSWQYVLQRRDDRKEYINLYSNKLILGTLTGEDADRLGELERKLEFEDLLQYRSVAKAFAKKSQASTPKGYGTRILGWLGFKESANVYPTCWVSFLTNYPRRRSSSKRKTSRSSTRRSTLTLRASREPTTPCPMRSYSRSILSSAKDRSPSPRIRRRPSRWHRSSSPSFWPPLSRGQRRWPSTWPSRTWCWWRISCPSRTLEN